MSELEHIFHEALELPEAAREEFIVRQCGNNLALAADVRSLLSYEQQPTAPFAAAIEPVAADLFAVRALQPGTMLGPFRIAHKIGEGGMGAVYHATDTRLHRDVALKILRHSLGNHTDALARFQREARAAAALSHPNIAMLHDFGESSGAPWLVMELIDGESLRAKLNAGPLTETNVLRYAGQLAEALVHAHSRGIIHRDIKPENLLIAQNGTLKVIDFGIADLVHDAAAPSPFGTPAYAAPEVLTGQPLTEAADIYSAGIVLREMAAGRPILAAVIERCLAPDPATRFRNGARLAAALRAANGPAPPTGNTTVAIVDFTNLANDPAIDWLGAGIAETLAARLSKLRFVRVASRSAPPPANARWVVSGSYQRSGEQVRVTPQLRATATGETLVAGAVDGHWAEIFSVQDRVAALLAHAIVNELGEPLAHSPSAPETRSLVAYEHFARGRQHMYQMSAAALALAIQHFEEAIALDPDYALAYSALGTSCALRFLRTSSPADIQRASACLEQAIALDPELGEPYPWVANIRSRKNDPAGAFAAGRKGVELQPDLPEAHYFFGGLHYMLAEARLYDSAIGIHALREAIRLQPRLHPAYLLLGALHSWRGEHAEAIPVLTEAIARETEVDLLYRFVGARTLRAVAYFRSGQWDLARAAFQDAFDSLTAGPEHLYRECFLVLSALGIADLDLRANDASSAIAHYRRAWRIVKESPRIVGSSRLLIRAAAGLAAAYAATGDAARARELVLDASQQLEAVAGQTASVTFECGLAQLHLSLASAYHRLGDDASASTHLGGAIDAGWSDLAWLGLDPELSPLG